MNKKAFITTALAAAILLSGCSANTTEQPETEKGSSQSAASALSVLSEKMDFSYSERDLDGGWDSQNATMIHLNDGASSINGPGAKLEDGLLTISEEGVYVLSGSLTSGRVVVNADKTAKLQVVLNEVSISSPDYAAFTVEQADKVFLTLAEGTKNYLTDADSYTLRSEEDNTDAALFSREDLTINGTGSLDIQPWHDIKR